MEATAHSNQKNNSFPAQPKMKRIILLSLLAMISICSQIEARTIIVKISNIRGEKGNILVMAQSGKESKPVYGMAKPNNGEVTVNLENIEWEQFDLSVVHDENDNFQMDFTEDKRPAEGYVMKNCKTRKEEDTIKLKLYYPSNE